jgi:hypothetical protein
MNGVEPSTFDGFLLNKRSSLPLQRQTRSRAAGLFKQH